MNITQITDSLQNLLNNFDKDEFIYQLLRAYNIPNASIARLKKGGLNLSKNPNEIDWKTKLFYKIAEPTENVHEIMEELKANGKALKNSPRFMVVTDFTTLLAWDVKMAEALDIPLTQLVQHYDFFLPWAGMEKATHQYENPADVKAAEKMAKLYDEISKDNRNVATLTKEDVHSLNVFLSRLLFCFFAEDTGIFEKSQFTHDIKDHTQEDGSDLHTYLDRLFELMNTPLRDDSLPKHLRDFPYVNGGLFQQKHQAPTFSRRSRAILIECGELDWAAINPDIFGSMIQAVITPEHRGGMGMHYTSVPNIMKVIEPLFLDNLLEEFESAKGNIKKINELLKRIWSIKIFDPACGSGNFLIIAYKKMRELEMAIFKEIDRIKGKLGSGIFDFGGNSFSEIRLDNFYGIELDDFAHEIAILSLWLAEHQMNQEFFKEFGRTRPALPLKATGNIVHGNATRLDWEVVCPKKEQDEIYILGNPPYLGSSMQSAEQKEDMALVFKGIKDYKNLDYIACWFLKGAKFIQNQNAQFAFVSTNSICQGEQVALLWPHIFNRNLEIGFAHTSFKWNNNAKANAAVIVVIVSIKPTALNKTKLIINSINKIIVDNINPYLTKGRSTFVVRTTKSISLLTPMVKGNQPTDGGHFILNKEERSELLSLNSNSSQFIKKLIGSDELINSKERWCLWINDETLSEATQVDIIKTRINNVKYFRSQSPAPSTVNFTGGHHRFIQIQHEPEKALVIPSVSSENRIYIPIGFVDNHTVVTNLAFAIYNPETWLFAVLTSRMHMTWVRAVAGRLKSDYRYSSALCYNTFPFPPISDTQKDELKKHVFQIIGEREQDSEKTLAQLYDPEKMPEGLREAHRQNDLAVERCYRSKPFESDEERLEYLFKLYEKMIEEEKTKGTLFAMERKGKGKKK
ncbi:type II restriction/modification system DNA methylase subunit YeeA [Arcicella aurantiaca]|uniref:site-specific DNA-methyltransferase (adenine-specific) n=1 Tax=Arcicella aurantiaca TaxID=591202 RepID=A0A316EGR3_9BACT|nr:DNA methyltransferase [Arcicella aurantiaca]PWK28944.1 type II restriction/modification system DNA methylase subunit YeeA [Arcicella aurantiaca]